LALQPEPLSLPVVATGKRDCCSDPRSRYTSQTESSLEGQVHHVTGELARRLDDVIQRGIVGSKPEAIRQALIEYFNKLDEQQLRRARLKLLEREQT
jgi:hypothetical protein